MHLQVGIYSSLYFSCTNLKYLLGPYWALPMVGHLLQVAKYGLKSPTFALSELAKIYGDVYSLKLGSLNYGKVMHL